MTDANWQVLTGAVMVLGLGAFVVVEIVHIVRGLFGWSKHTHELWFGPLQRYLRDRKRA